MTRAEAIEQLRYGGHVEGSDDFMRAFWMAVDALEQEPYDAISREEVKRWVCSRCDDDVDTTTCQMTCNAMKEIDELPSVELQKQKKIL